MSTILFRIGDKALDIDFLSAVCKECGRLFKYQPAFYRLNGISEPQRCRRCRIARKTEGKICIGQDGLCRLLVAPCPRTGLKCQNCQSFFEINMQREGHYVAQKYDAFFDKRLTCRICGQSFLYGASWQSYIARKKFLLLKLAHRVNRKLGRLKVNNIRIIDYEGVCDSGSKAQITDNKATFAADILKNGIVFLWIENKLYVTGISGNSEHTINLSPSLSTSVLPQSRYEIRIK